MPFNKLVFPLLFLAFTFIACNKCKDVTCNDGYACDKGECIRVSDIISSNNEKDPCTSSNCLNGTCDNGDCECEDYWFGDACDTAVHVDYIHSYTGSYICPGFSKTFTYYFSPGENPEQIFFSDSNGTDLIGTIKIDDFDRFTINPQSFFDSTNVLYTVRGFGERIGEDMNITFTIDREDGNNQTCGFTGKENE